jgi:hypothetical protein
MPNSFIVFSFLSHSFVCPESLAVSQSIGRAEIWPLLTNERTWNNPFSFFFPQSLFIQKRGNIISCAVWVGGYRRNVITTAESHCSRLELSLLCCMGTVHTHESHPCIHSTISPPPPPMTISKEERWWREWSKLKGRLSVLARSAGFHESFH